jgi:type I restriction enzyme R subunit
VSRFTETTFEEATLHWSDELGYVIRQGQAIARELVSAVTRNVTIDWTMRENVRAQMRVLIKRILRKHGYRPDKQEKATQTVLEQAELLAEEWAIS